MGGGRLAYILHSGKPSDRSEMVDIFDYAEPTEIGTVQQQRDYFAAWLRSLVRPHPGEVEEALRTPDGWVYRIAGNFGPDDRVPPEAVIGAWKVDSQGKIIGDFIRNENYDPIRWPSRSGAI
jgi:hypothetical protein